ncbi:MAG: FAD-dependent oxidoreductase [Rikenellaceae bacterium]|nr:FAD-dependent oxidoreductase [Rikenellaceae bacterium]MBR3801374.1 FAD-dependent oxidoreductase [Rikenellaceae bacterium]
MKRILNYAVAIVVAAFLTACGGETYDVVVIGGGVSGTTAGIRAARLGAQTLIVEQGPWLGGMLTSAGVSATDGNYRLRGGMWGELRDSLEAHYGGAQSLKTGWVSNLLFEPSVGARIFRAMADNEEALTVKFETRATSIERTDGGWTLTLEGAEGRQTVECKVLIDGTELGDVAAQLGVKYDIGMESRNVTGEDIAPEEANGIIQDLTMVMILKDYGRDMTIERPSDYDSTVFACACDNAICRTPKEANRLWSKQMMMTYGRLPNGKIMINWPIEGNDYYVNMIEMNDEERAEAVAKAKAHTRNFLYFIQHDLGLNTLYLADDEFPTEDLMPLMPYHRESRRTVGEVRFKLNHITDPYDFTLYRTAIAVGDYPVDQHHTRYTGWEALPNLYFHSIPSYGLPMGVLLPKEVDGLIVAEKSISVSNIVNGSTRLQPVVLQIGEAAGIVAALAVKQGIEPREVSVREVQREVLAGGGYLLPFLDLPATDPHFGAIQRVGVTGIIEGVGMTVGWENQSWFRINEAISMDELSRGLHSFDAEIPHIAEQRNVTVQDLIEHGSVTAEQWAEWGLENFDPQRDATRLECAVVIDKVLNPFAKGVTINGEFI